MIRWSHGLQHSDDTQQHYTPFRHSSKFRASLNDTQIGGEFSFHVTYLLVKECYPHAFGEVVTFHFVNLYQDFYDVFV